MRHSFATHLLNKGVGISAIQSLLGHSKLSSTQIYTHVSIDKLQDTIDKAHPRGKKWLKTKISNEILTLTIW